MNRTEPLIKEYERAKDNIILADMNVTQMAGYYIAEFPNSAVRALMEDVYQHRVPFTVAYPARLIIESLGGGE